MLPQQPEESYKVKVKSGDREIAAFVNPYTGAILGWWGFENIFTHFLLKIHITLLAGKVGETIVGVCGLIREVGQLKLVGCWHGILPFGRWESNGVLDFIWAALVEECEDVPHIRKIGEEKWDENQQKNYPARRWVVERTLGWLSKCRAILVRYDKKACNYLGFIKLACALLWYRRCWCFSVLR